MLPVRTLAVALLGLAFLPALVDADDGYGGGCLGGDPLVGNAFAAGVAGVTDPLDSWDGYGTSPIIAGWATGGGTVIMTVWIDGGTTCTRACQTYFTQAASVPGICDLEGTVDFQIDMRHYNGIPTAYAITAV